jgi:hypothetical protein
MANLFSNHQMAAALTLRLWPACLQGWDLAVQGA